MYVLFQVVDARAGPGIKSMTKFKVKNRKHLEEKAEKNKLKKLFVREDSPVLSDKSEGNEEAEYAEVDFLLDEGPSGGSSRAESPGVSDCEEVVERNRRYTGLPKQKRHIERVSDFVDPHYWKKWVFHDSKLFNHSSLFLINILWNIYVQKSNVLEFGWQIFESFLYAIFLVCHKESIITQNTIFKVFHGICHMVSYCFILINDSYKIQGQQFTLHQ